MVGLFVGMVRFIWEFSYGAAPPCGTEDTRHFLISKVHYLHFGKSILQSPVTVPSYSPQLQSPVTVPSYSKGFRIKTNF